MNEIVSSQMNEIVRHECRTDVEIDRPVDDAQDEERQGKYHPGIPIYRIGHGYVAAAWEIPRSFPRSQTLSGSFCFFGVAPRIEGVRSPPRVMGIQTTTETVVEGSCILVKRGVCEAPRGRDAGSVTLFQVEAKLSPSADVVDRRCGLVLDA